MSTAIFLALCLVCSCNLSSSYVASSVCVCACESVHLLEQLIIYFSIFSMNVYFSLIYNPTLKVRVRNIFVNYECVDKYYCSVLYY